MSTSINSAPVSTTFWIGKPSTHKLWHHINDYVNDYTSENQHELQSEWVNKWFFLINDIKIADKTRDFQVIALSLASNPDASILDCINAAMNIIPNLRNHLAIIDHNSDKGTYQCRLERYKFTTPPEKKLASTPPRPKTKQSAFSTTNRYAAFTDFDQEEDKDNLIFYDMTLPPPPGNDIILENHSASSLSHDSICLSIELKHRISLDEHPLQQGMAECLGRRI